MECDAITTVKECNQRSRIRRKKETKRDRAKKSRYHASVETMAEFKKVCNHNGPTFCCSELTLTDIREMRKSFYATNNKIEQDIKLCHFLSVKAPERKRSNENNNPRKREFCVTYFLSKHATKKKYQVCQAMLLRVLNVSKDRVNHVAKFCFEGKIPKENRGGDRVSQKNEEKKQSIREFLDMLPAQESHYNRMKSKRVYLDCTLNIKKLFSYYKEQCAPKFKQTKFDMFRNVFLNEYNIGFNTPASDCCAQCTRLKNLKKKEKDEEQRQKVALELTMHKKSANTFYELLRESPPNSMTFCFDLQQVQPLPRTPINDAFYSHQVSLYIFCCVDSRAQKPTFYTWTEDQAGRGSEEVGSALLQHLDSLSLDNISIIRLFCDGCGGQNRNLHIIHTLYYWLKIRAPPSVLEICLTFPVRGHSFLPADRVFGRVEKDLRKNPTLISRAEYEVIYRKHGEVKILGSSNQDGWKLYNIKDLEKKLKKINGIAEMKVIKLKKINEKVTVCGFPHFRFRTGVETFTKLTKPKAMDIVAADLTEKPISQRGIPSKKKKSLTNLLVKLFGTHWREDEDLAWYKELLDAADNYEEEKNAECDCLTEELAVHI